MSKNISTKKVQRVSKAHSDSIKKLLDEPFKPKPRGTVKFPKK